MAWRVTIGSVSISIGTACCAMSADSLQVESWSAEHHLRGPVWTYKDALEREDVTQSRWASLGFERITAHL